MPACPCTEHAMNNNTLWVHKQAFQFRHAHQALCIWHGAVCSSSQAHHLQLHPTYKYFPAAATPEVCCTCLTIVSTSMPENPKALSPSTATTSRSVQVAAAIAYPNPTPMVPHVPASSLSLPSTAGSNISLSISMSLSVTLLVLLPKIVHHVLSLCTY